MNLIINFIRQVSFVLLFGVISLHAASITMPTSMESNTANYVLFSTITTPAISSFTGNVRVVVADTNGTLKITTTANLTAPVGYTTAQWANGASEIAFIGTQTDVNNALATLQYKNSTNEPTTILKIAATPTGATYNLENGHYYVMSSAAATDATTATTAATSSTFNGLTGYLLSITSASENSFIVNKVLDGNSSRISASDATSEGNWTWGAGLENGTKFWIGTSTGNAINSAYSNWAGGEPNDFSGAEDTAQIDANGAWNDLPSATSIRYAIEYVGNGGTATEEATATFAIASTQNEIALSSYDITTGLAASAFSRTSGNPSSTSEDVQFAFDDDTSTKYLNDGGAGTGAHIDLGSFKIVTGIGLTTANDASWRDPVKYTLSGSDDNTTFVQIASGYITAPETRLTAYYPISFTNSISYRYYKLIFDAKRGNTDAYIGVSEISLFANNATYTENEAPKAILTDATISYASSNLGATITISTGLDTSDVLAFTNTDGTTYGSISGSYSSSTGILTLSGAGTALQYQNAFKAVTYSSTSEIPTINNKTRILKWQLNNGTIYSNVITSTIAITALNDAPAVSSTALTAATEGSLYNYELKGSDIDSDTLSWSVTSGTTLASWLYLNTTAVVSTFKDSANFSQPRALEVAPDGNIYVADSTTNKILKITPSGVVTTFAGNGSSGHNDGASTVTTFNGLEGMVFDSVGNLYIADRGNNAIRKITPLGIVTTFAGSSGATSGDVDAVGTAARFAGPGDIAIDSNDNLYVTDSGNSKIRKITPAGVVTTLTSAIANVNNITIDSNDNLFVTNGTQNRLVYKVTLSGTVTTFAGSGTDAVTDGDGTNASFSNPFGITIDSSNNLYITEDNPSNVIRKITPDGNVTTVAGIATTNGSQDANGTNATFSNPASISIDSNGSLYIVDWGGKNLRKIDFIHTLNGTPTNSEVGTHDVNLTLSDGNLSVTHNFQISVSNINDAPTITSNGGGASASISIAENTTALTTVTSSDVDSGDTAIYSINGTDSAKFDINSTSGVLTFVTAPNYENPTDSGANNVYELNVTATDNGTGSLTDVQEIAITITNVNDLPTLNSSTVSFTDTTTTDTFTNQTGTLTSTDSDDSTFTYLFATSASVPTGPVNAVTYDFVQIGTYGSLYIKTGGDYVFVPDSNVINSIATNLTSTFDINVTDSGGGTGSSLTSTGQITINLTATNDAPSIATSTTTTDITMGLATSSFSITSGSTPSTEKPEFAFDDTSTSKYLNFGGAGTGILIDASSSYVISAINLRTANDAFERDPTSYEISGSNDNILYSSIASGSMTAPTARYTAYGEIPIFTSQAYRYYKLKFNSVRTSGSDIQLSEIAIAGTTYNNVAYTENGVATSAISNLILTDNEGNISSASVTISSNFLAGDVLAFTNDSSANYGSISASYNSTTGVLSLSTTATVAQYQNALKAVTFSSTSDNPTKNGTLKTLSWQANDGTSNSNTATSTITVTAVNNAPTFTSNGVTTVAENSAYSYAIDVSDVDSNVTKISTTNLPSWLSVGSASTVSTLANTYNFPSSIAFDSNGNMFIVEIYGNKISKITPSGVKSTFAGSGTAGFADANGTNAQFNNPFSIVIDGSNNIYVSDTFNQRIRKITPNGNVTTLAGSGGYGSKDSTVGTSATFKYPRGIALDSAGNIFLADSYNSTIRKITQDGVVTTFAGSVYGFTNGTGTAASFVQPKGIAIDSLDNLYVADSGNNVIRKITPSGEVTTFAGTGSKGSNDGNKTTATFRQPYSLAVDKSNNIYVADTYNLKIRKITSSGDVTTLAGDGSYGSVDGTGTSTSFAYPWGITIDSGGVIYVANTYKSNIRKIVTDQSTLRGTPTVSGVYDINLTLSDGNLSDTQNFQITVSDVNDAPVLSDGSFVVSENNATGSNVGTLNIYDEDGVNPSLALIGSAETFTYSIIAGNTNNDFNISSSTGEIFIAKALDPYTIQNYSLTVKALDDGGLSDTATVTIAVSSKGRAPVAVADSTTTNEDTNATINVLSNDTDLDNNINSGSVVITVQPTHAKVFVSSSGVVTYEPTVNYFGTDYFTYKVYDELGLVSNEINSTITIVNVNDAPVTVSGSTDTKEDINTTVSVSFLTSDSDGISDVSIYTVETSVSHGVLVASSSAFEYEPTPNYYGFDSFTFSATDANGTKSNISTVNLNIAEVNDIPIAYADELNTTEDNAGTVAVLSNDIDDNGLDTSTVAILNSASHGTLVVNGDGTITYTPNSNWYGVDTFSYTVKDDGIATGTQSSGVLISNEGFVTVNVTSVNDAPTAVADSVTLNEDGISLTNLYANDTDVDSDLNGTSITIVTQPTNGEANVTSNGLVRYISTKDYSGADSFTYKISDGDVNSSTATVNLTINAVNDAPSFVTNKENNVTENNTSTILTAIARDIDDANSSLTYTMLSGKDSSFFTFNTITKELSFTSARDYETPADANSDNIYDVDINVTDASGAPMTRTFNVRVTNVNDALTLTSNGGGSTASISAAENQTAVTALTSSANGTVTYSIVSGNDAASFSIDSSTGVLTFISAPDYETKNSYTLTVQVDDNGTTANQTITVNITNANDAPTFTSSGTTSATENSAYSYTPIINDVDGDLISVNVINAPSWLSLSGSFTVTTLAGSGLDSSIDATGTNASFRRPRDVASDSSGNIFVADQYGNKIRKITLAGVVTTFAGTGSYGSVDGNGTSASFSSPTGLTIDSNNNIYVADNNNNKIRKITPSGVVTTFATVQRPYGITIDNSTNDLYVGTNTHKIVKVTSAGVVTTFAGSGIAGSTDATGTSASFYNPDDIVIDSNKNLFVADTYNHKIRKITPAGVVTTFAGSGLRSSIDGNGTSASFYYPFGLAIDNFDNIYVADYYNNKIRKITSAGVVTTFAGTGRRGIYNSGSSSSTFYFPMGITLDSSGNLYVATSGGRSIRKIVAGSKTLSGTPTVSGIYDVNLSVTDGNLSSPQNYQITVSDVNDAPVLNDASFVISENNATGSTVGTVTATDEDGVNPSLALIGSAEVQTYSITAGNTNNDFNINSSTGQITIAKDLNAYTTSNYSLTIKTQDDGGLSDTTTVTITVSNLADAPIAVADSSTISEDNNATINILSNDTDKDNNIANSSVVITVQPTNGSVKVSASGVATYTPNANYYGSDYFTYKVYDATSLSSNEVNATITVNAVNDAPITTNIVLKTNEDQNLTENIATFVSDVDDSSLTYTIVDNSNINGVVSLSNGLLEYNPTANYYGTASFTYKVIDGNNSTSNTSTIKINVAAINDIPIANNDYDNNTTEDNSITINVLANDTDDGDLDASTVSVVNSPTHGTTTVANDGNITYTPNANYYGYDTFGYTVKDDGLITAGLGSTGVLVSNIATVSVNINSINDTPTAVNDSFTLNEDSVMLLNLHANDTDVEGDLNGTAISIVTQPSHGKANVTSVGLVRYIPTKDYSGADSFTYKISDGDVNSSTATVNLTINAVNDAPSFTTSKDLNITENSSSVIATLSAQDIENNTPLTYTKISGKDGSFFTLTGANLSFTNTRNYESPADANSDNIYDVDVNVTDNSGASNLRTFNVKVTNVNDAPTLTSNGVVEVPVVEVPVVEVPVVEVPVVEVPVVEEPTPAPTEPPVQGATPTIVTATVQDPTKIEIIVAQTTTTTSDAQSNGEKNVVAQTIVINEVKTGVSLSGGQTTVPDAQGFTTEIQRTNKDGSAAANLNIKTAVEPIITTTQEGLELKTTLDTTSGDSVEMDSKIFSNGTIQVISKTTASDGASTQHIVQSLLADVAIESKEDGSTHLSNTAENTTVEAQVSAEGLSAYSISIKDVVIGKEVITKAESEIDNSVVTIREDGAVQINAQAQTDVGTTLSFVVEAQPDGTAIHALKVTDSNGKEMTTSATSQAKGAQTTLAKNGTISTEVFVEATDIVVQALPNGDAVHQVSNGGVTTIATSSVSGAQTIISETGEVNTQTQNRETVNGITSEVRTTVVTAKDGTSFTKFERVLDDGSVELINNTTSPETPFEPGNEVHIEEVNGALQIRVITTISKEIQF